MTTRIDDTEVAKVGPRERLGLDCDGVLANFALYTLGRVNRELALKLRVSDWQPWLEESPLAQRVGRHIFKMMEEERLWRELPPYPNLAARIAQLRQRYDIYVVTAIDERFAAVRAEWLNRHGVPHEGLVCVADADLKVGVARELGLCAFVEDLPSVSVQMAGAGIDSYLVRRPWNERVELAPGVRRGEWRQISHWLRKRPLP